MDIALCINKLLPAAQYGGVPGRTKEEYDSLRWEDSRTKPTWKQIQDAWPLVQIDIENIDTYRQLDDTDKKMSRALEDYIDMNISLGKHTYADMPVYLKQTYDKKKELRGKIK